MGAKAITQSTRSERSGLSRRELVWARAAFECFGGGHDAPVRAADVRFEPALDAYARAVPRRARLGLRVALCAVAFGPLLVGRRLALLPSLPLEQRAVVLQRLLSSSLYPLRQLALLVKMLSALLYAAAPELGSVARAPALESGPRLIGAGRLARPARAIGRAGGSRAARRMA